MFLFETLTTRYELVYTFLPKPIHKLGCDGFFYVLGRRRGFLIKSTGSGHIYYHNPEDYFQLAPARRKRKNQLPVILVDMALKKRDAAAHRITNNSTGDVYGYQNTVTD